MTKLGRTMLAGLAAGVCACAGGCSAPDMPPANAADAAVARHAAGGTDDLRSTRERARYDVELAQADDNHRIATLKCEVLTGVQAKACRAQADADYEMLKSIARTQYPDLASAR